MDRAERRRRLAVLALAAIGLVTSLYLVALHERLAAGDLSPSVCAVSAEIDCAPALLSRYASVGGVPVAAYGAWFYALVIVVACLGSVTTSRGAAGPRLIVLLGATLVASLVSVALALLSFFMVGALCPLCALLYAVNLALFSVAWMDVARRPGGLAAACAKSRAAATGRPLQTLVLGGFVLATFSALPIAYGFADRTSALCKAIRSAAEDGRMSLTVYADYQCPHCKQLDRQLRRARSMATFDIVLKNHPLDRECNPWATRTTFPGSCLQARAAICAEREGRMDAFADQLFERRANDESTLIALARTLGIDPDAFRSCLAAPSTAARLAEEIRIARERDVRVTPTIVLGDVRHVGTLSRSDLQCLETAGR